MEAAANNNTPFRKLFRKLAELFRMLQTPADALAQVSKTPGPPRFWWTFALAATIGFVAIGWPKLGLAVGSWAFWLLCWLADVSP